MMIKQVQSIDQYFSFLFFQQKAISVLDKCIVILFVLFRSQLFRALKLSHVRLGDAGITPKVPHHFVRINSEVYNKLSLRISVDFKTLFLKKLESAVQPCTSSYLYTTNIIHRVDNVNDSW